MSAFKVFTNDIPQFFSIQLFFIASLAPLSSTVSETQCLEVRVTISSAYVRGNFQHLAEGFLLSYTRVVLHYLQTIYSSAFQKLNVQSLFLLATYVCLCVTHVIICLRMLFICLLFLLHYTHVRVDHYVLDMKSIISEIYYEVQQTILWRELVSNHDQTLTNLWTLTTLLIRLLTTYFIINIYCLFYIYIYIYIYCM